MPHVLTMNAVKQTIPRQRLPRPSSTDIAAATLGRVLARRSILTLRLSAPGHSARALCCIATVPLRSARFPIRKIIEAYRHPSLEFVVNQSIWMENEAQFADVICPHAPRSNAGTFRSWGQLRRFSTMADQVNHRTVIMQHKCIEPLGESKSGLPQIFLDILTRLGLGALFSEGGDARNSIGASASSIPPTCRSS